MNSKTNTVQLASLLGDFRLLMILFASFRLMMLIVYQPIVVNGVERGVGAGGDRAYHYELAELTKDGKLPFRDWWSEFPPVWFLTTTTVYQFLGANVNFTSWSMVLGLLVMIFDVGNLILIRAIGSQLHGANTGIALAWVYAVSVAPLVFIWWNFETLVAFFMLLAIWLLMSKKGTRGAIIIALGALTKFTPALILGAVWRFRRAQIALRHTIVAAGVFALVYVLLLIGNPNPQMALVSLTAQFGKASYETVWALIDGNYKTGNFGTVESHLDPTQASALEGNSPRVPAWLRLGVAGAIGLWVFFRTRRLDYKGFVAFVGITLLIFFLQAQGWSPQWIVQIIPLVLLAFPTRQGVILTVILSLVTFAEYPLLFIRTGDTNGEITGALLLPYTILVLARTGILIGLCVAFYQRLREDPVVEPDGDE